MLTLNIPHNNVTQDLYLVIRIPHTCVPTVWDSQQPNHRKQHDIYQLYIIWVTMGQPRRARWTLALQEIVIFILLTAILNIPLNIPL